MLKQGSSSAARESIRKHSRSFSFASRLLPADRRGDVEKLYAWCRWCDDGVDMALSPAKAAIFVQQACDDLNRIAAGKPPMLPESGWLASLSVKYDLSMEAAKALLKGMESDLSPATPFSEDDLLNYCFQAAGSVGVLMCPVLGLRDLQFLPHAAALGMGMQLTNIARDVAEDWRRSRCYLPEEWTGGLRPGSTPPDPDRVQRGVVSVLSAADGFYAAGEAGIHSLATGSQLAVLAASRIYHQIGVRIKSNGFRVLERRAHVSFSGKIGLFASCLFSRVLKTTQPALDENAVRCLDTAHRLLQQHGVMS
jgi:phytoene synthase